MPRPGQAGIVGVLTCGLASGCSLLPTGPSETCVDWIRFETPQAQYDHAALVVIGKPVRADGETALSGYRANVHLLDVETVLKGSAVPFDVGTPLPFRPSIRRADRGSTLPPHSQWKLKPHSRRK